LIATAHCSTGKSLVGIFDLEGSAESLSYRLLVAVRHNCETAIAPYPKLLKKNLLF
jgi:hypothetical protein